MSDQGIPRRDFLERCAAGGAAAALAHRFVLSAGTVRADTPFCFWQGSSDAHRPYTPGSGLASGKKLEDVELPPFLPDADEVRSDVLDYYFEVERFDGLVGSLLTEIDNRIKRKRRGELTEADVKMLIDWYRKQ